MIKNNRIRMLFSVLLLSTTLQATTFKVQIDGGFIPGAEEGTKTKFAATVNFEQPLTLSQTPNPVNKVLLWGNPDATNHTKTQSSLQTVGTDRLVNATSPGDQLEYYTVGGVAHNNFPIDAEHGSLIFTQMAWGIKILDETGKQTLLNEIAILDLYNWETDNFDFSNPDGIRKPCERDTMGEIVYNFKKDGSSYILKNGESSHSFLGDGFDTSERGCDDAHEFKEVHITQTFDYLDNGCPKTYSVSLNGFYDYKDISNLYAQPKRTFWAREDWKSIGIIKLAIIEHDNNCNGGSGGGSGGGDKPGVDPTPPDNGGGSGGGSGGSDCIDQCPDGCNNDCYCCEDEGNIDNGGSTDDNGSEDDTGNNPGDINDSENKPYHKSSASALGNISILLMILLTFLLVSKRLKMKLD